MDSSRVCSCSCGCQKIVTEAYRAHAIKNKNKILCETCYYVPTGCFCQTFMSTEDIPFGEERSWFNIAIKKKKLNAALGFVSESTGYKRSLVIEDISMVQAIFLIHVVYKQKIAENNGRSVIHLVMPNTIRLLHRVGKNDRTMFGYSRSGSGVGFKEMWEKDYQLWQVRYAQK